MNVFDDCWIERIYVILKKVAPPEFYFKNTGRKWDGFVYLLCGGGEFIDEQGNITPVAPGDCVFLSRNKIYAFKLREGSEYITTAYDLLTESTSDSPYHLILHLTDGQGEKLQELLSVFSGRARGYLTKCRILLLSMYSEISSKLRNEKTQTESNAARAVEYINKHFKENTRIELIAEYCNCSPSYLRACFKLENGISMSKYRELLRIREAEKMLKSGIVEIKAISEELGYCDIYHFSKSFKAATGFTPKSLKKSFHTKK